MPYQSGNGAVLEIHAADAACYFEHSREMTKNACISGDLNHMTFTSLSKDSLINIGIPQIGNGSSLAAYACIAEHRGIPRADSRGKHYDEQGIIAMSLMNHVKVYQTKVGDLHFESVEHEDNLDLSNMIFLGCSVRKVRNIFANTVTSLWCENAQADWKSVTPHLGHLEGVPQPHLGDLLTMVFLTI